MQESKLETITNLFEGKAIRSIWDAEKEDYYFSVVVISTSTESKDGKFYTQEVLDTEGVLRLIESMPSPNGEPFKMWLAHFGRKEMDNIFNLEKANTKDNSVGKRYLEINKEILNEK